MFVKFSQEGVSCLYYYNQDLVPSKRFPGTCGVVCKSLLYNKLAIFRVGETATLKIANRL